MSSSPSDRQDRGRREAAAERRRSRAGLATPHDGRSGVSGGRAEPVTRIPLTDRSAHRGGIVIMVMVVAAAAAYLTPIVQALLGWRGGSFAYLFPLVALALGIPGWRATAPTAAVVGADGLTVGAYGWKRFIPLDRIDSIHGDEHAVEIRLRGGKKRVITTYNTEFSRERIAELAACVAAAQRDRRRAPPGAAPSPHLERRGRSLEAWRRDLRALVAEGRDYRHASLSADDLAAVLEDAEALPEQRIGAALALAERGDTGARPRIRIAADACANETVRVALTSVAEGEGDEQAIDEALAASRPRGRAR